jgi:hypothetical protein
LRIRIETLLATSCTCIGEVLFCPDQVGEDDLVDPGDQAVGLALLQPTLTSVGKQHSVGLSDREKTYLSNKAVDTLVL